MAFMASTSAMADITPPQIPKRFDVLRAHHRSKLAQQPSVRASEVAQETGLMRALHGAFLTALPMPPVALAAAAASQPHVVEPSTNVRSITGPQNVSRAVTTASRKRRSMSPAAALPPVPQSQPFINFVSRAPQMNLSTAAITGAQNLSALSSPAKRAQYNSSQAPFPFAGPTCTEVPLNLHGCVVASGFAPPPPRLPPTVLPAAPAASYDSHWYAPPPLPPQAQSQIQLQPQPQPQHQHQPQTPSFWHSLHQPPPPAQSQGIASSLPQPLGSFCVEPVPPVLPLAPPLARAMPPPQSLAPQTTCLGSVFHLSQPQTQLQPQPQLMLQRQQQQLQQPPLQLVSPFAVPTQSIAFTSYSQADPSMTYFYPY